MLNAGCALGRCVAGWSSFASEDYLVGGLGPAFLHQAIL